MAKYNKTFQTNVNDLAMYIEKQVLQGSMSASLEEKQICQMHDLVCYVYAFERYSYTGSNRVSMNVTILGDEKEAKVLASASGGSQGVIFKINIWGEESFLDTLRAALEDYQK